MSLKDTFAYLRANFGLALTSLQVTSMGAYALRSITSTLALLGGHAETGLSQGSALSGTLVFNYAAGTLSPGIALVPSTTPSATVPELMYAVLDQEVTGLSTTVPLVPRVDVVTIEADVDDDQASTQDVWSGGTNVLLSVNMRRHATANVAIVQGVAGSRIFNYSALPDNTLVLYVIYHDGSGGVPDVRRVVRPFTVGGERAQLVMPSLSAMCVVRPDGHSANQFALSYSGNIVNVQEGLYNRQGVRFYAAAEFDLDDDDAVYHLVCQEDGTLGVSPTLVPGTIWTISRTAGAFSGATDRRNTNRWLSVAHLTTGGDLVLDSLQADEFGTKDWSPLDDEPVAVSAVLHVNSAEPWEWTSGVNIEGERWVWRNTDVYFNAGARLVVSGSGSEINLGAGSVFNIAATVPVTLYPDRVSFPSTPPMDIHIPMEAFYAGRDELLESDGLAGDMVFSVVRATGVGTSTALRLVGGGSGQTRSCSAVIHIPQGYQAESFNIPLTITDANVTIEFRSESIVGVQSVITPTISTSGVYTLDVSQVTNFRGRVKGAVTVVINVTSLGGVGPFLHLEAYAMTINLTRRTLG